MSKFTRRHNGYEVLNEQQKSYIVQELTRCIINKEHGGVSDFRRIGACLFSICKANYLIDRDLIMNLLNEDTQYYSEHVLTTVGDLAEAAGEIYAGSYEQDDSEFIQKLKSLV